MISVGILGLPNVGKSTLFQALTKKQVGISNYPFSTIEPNIGLVEVPDERLEKLAKISQPEKVTRVVIKFIDVAGLVKGAAQGEGLGNQFLAHLRECDLLLEVVRCFKNERVSHFDPKIDPLRDIEIIEQELTFKDLETIEKRLKKIEKEAKKGIKEFQQEYEKLIFLKEKLKNKENIFSFSGLEHLFLLTLKPRIYLLNCCSEELKEEVKKFLSRKNRCWLLLNLREELEKSDLSPQERAEFNLGEPKLSQLIEKCYQVLDQITFFTMVGEKEIRAWSVKKGTTILEGAGKIHSDFKEKFILGEVLDWQKVTEVGGWKRCRQLGLLKRVGKHYILKDGEVVEIKHN